MAKNVTALSNALRQPRTPEPAAPAPAASHSKPASRVGKLHISAWLSPDFKSSLRAIQIKHPQKTMQSLHIEALNDLFSKYNVPVVREE